MPAANFLKYARQNTPRYTSYPTAPHFHEGINHGVFPEWLASLNPAAAGSLYIHIPYCREMCWYCGCSTRATQKTGPVAAYTETLLTEIDLAANCFKGRAQLAHIHFGGGTPTILTDEQFSAIMDRIRKRFTITATAEIAIEIDPRIFTATKAAHLARNGVNRASLGVQTFDAGVQARINRVQPADQVENCVRNLRAAGINDISFDLLYGLPGQTLASCRDTVTAALAMRPDRLSVFGYAHVPHLKRHQKLIRDEDLPGPEARIEQALAIADAAHDAGLIPVGIDHYAQPQDGMGRSLASGQLRRNFQGYTTDQSEFLLGLGASAISRTPEGYAQNTADVGNWSKAITAGRLATSRGIELSADDHLRGAVIERLMCDLEVDIGRMEQAHEMRLDLPDLSDLEADNIIQRDGARITIAEPCRMLARIVAARFDSRLYRNAAARHSLSV
ncbi:MAG: oxygen-independent coproporphyrinogen III oxidase [Hyphobacterium sp.]|nr:MAG: oxygen-independent coproporphyrinogen III oxidase [Hyphobacterium sp.]